MICLSFDIEEFDAPREYGAAIPFDKQLEISTRGTEHILDLLDGMGVKATFFCTAIFAEHRPETIRRIVKDGHALGSHSYRHSRFESGDLLHSREILEQISGRSIIGYRSPRMGAVEYDELAEAGYLYDSSLNPTHLPGRYNNSKEPRSIFTRRGIIEIPSSVSSRMRIPLFWLALHNFPMSIYKYLADGALKKDGYLNIYFHPWEFTEQCSYPALRLPWYIKRNSGTKLTYRLGTLIAHYKERGVSFGTLDALVRSDKMAGK